MSTKTRDTRAKGKESMNEGQAAKSGRQSPRKQPVKTTKAHIDSEDEEDASQEESALAVKEPVKRGKKRKQGSEEKNEDKEKTYDSDALDDDSDAKPVKKKGRKRPQKSRVVKKKAKSQDDEAEFDYDIEDGQEVVGVVVQAPKTGHVPPGQISQNTLDFLNNLKKPECNDREWFKLHEPVYRLAEKEWNNFVEAFTDVLAGVDPQIPHLPPKDVIHRIYRDIRFSNDKTPYKKGFSASFSRSGRKGIFAHYHISVSPGNHSIIAAGCWQPGRNELATIRTNIQRNSRRLRDVISSREFVKFFGPPKPHPQGEHQNIFGFEDELKVAPKGVGKDHKDIDLLKCRSFCVVHHFTDSEVLAPDFKESLAKVARVVQPFVHCLNDMMTILGDDGDIDGEDEEGEGHEGDDSPSD